MTNTSILTSKLKDFKYYVDKLPMYLQQSAGFIEHFRIWYDILVGHNETNSPTGVVGVADTLFALLNIFDQEIDNNGNIRNKYIEYLNSLPDAEQGYAADILDKLGALFGVRRAFEVTYTIAATTYTKYVVLNNNDFLILIKAQIIKNYCDGSYKQIQQYYEAVGLHVYVTTSDEHAASNVYLVNIPNSAYQPSENIQAMFFAGLLTIQSMGIIYRHAYIDINTILIWDSDSIGWGDDTTYTGGNWVV